MSDVVIRAEGLGKKYMIGHQASGRERYTALRDVVGRRAKSISRSARHMVLGRQVVAGDEIEEFWALKDVSFEIKRGDVVGIIGRNGAGKSTLLKVLSRITEPSTGRVEIKGRVASLLEVGTGFHPELTGRENIYLNGAILGMSRAEIKSKFDEIVAFAEVERFLDTPVKRYSSGMYVRLAFAVAAHLEPEILVIDEILAVGDAEFQHKCLGKMQDVAGQGRTVLFVSHTLSAVRSLTFRCLYLKEGSVAMFGATSEVLAEYQRSSAGEINLSKTQSQTLLIEDVVINGSREQYQAIDESGFINIDITGRLKEARRVAFELNLRTATGIPIGSFFPEHFRSHSLGRAVGPFRVCASIKLPAFLTGEVIVSMSFTDPYISGFCNIDPLVTLQTLSPRVTSRGGDIKISDGFGPTVLEGEYTWEEAR